MKNEWRWHNFMSYGCFIKMYYFQFYTFCVLDPLIFFLISHVFTGFWKSWSARGPVPAGPAGQTALIAVAKSPSQDSDPSLTSLLASSDSLLLRICSCFGFSWYRNWSQSSAPSLFPTKYPTTLNISWSGRCDKFWGPWREVTQVPRSFLPSGRRYPFRPVPTLSHPTSSKLPVPAVWPPCPGLLSREPRSHCPLPLSACFSLKQQTCQECLHSPGPLHYLSPFTSIIWCIHPLRAPGQEPLLATSGMGTPPISQVKAFACLFHH